MESAKHVSNVFNIDTDLAARSYPTALYEVPAAPLSSHPLHLATTRITACYTSLSTAISSILQAIPCPKM